MPCQPSMTWGPLTPRPRLNRPPDIEARLIAVIATSAGERVPTCMIPVPSRMRDVRPAASDTIDGRVAALGRLLDLVRDVCRARDASAGVLLDVGWPRLA